MSGGAESKEQKETRRRARRRPVASYVRGLLLMAVVLLLLGGRGRHLALVMAALSPFVAVTSTVATRAFVGMAVLGLAIGLVVVFRRRWLCRWLCPVGFCTDGISAIGKRCGRKAGKGSSVGRWIVLLTLASAAVGVPLLLWVDPLAMFSGALGAFSRPERWFVAIPLLLVLGVSFVWPYVWCSRLCPLGAFQDILAGSGRFRWRREEPGTQRWNVPLARRTVLGVGLGAAGAAAAKLAGGSGARPLRPPGAIKEPGFLGVCVRCGNCIRACPTQIIEPALGQYGLASLLTPVVRFEAKYCLVECVKCMHVCPSGALGRLSAEGKGSSPIGRPRVDMNLCLLAESRECTECRRWCPHGAIRYEWSEEEYTLVPRIDVEKCTGCGACEAVCPVRPKRAIVVAPMGAQSEA